MNYDEIEKLVEILNDLRSGLKGIERFDSERDNKLIKNIQELESMLRDDIADEEAQAIERFYSGE